MKNFNNPENLSSRMWSGLIILVIGLVFLVRNMGIDIPDWTFSWHTILLVVGLIIGSKRNFNGTGWLIMVLIGGYFTLDELLDIDITNFYLPLALIIGGLFLILKPKTHNGLFTKKKTTDPSFADPVIDGGPASGDDFISSFNLFGGSKQAIFSKQFKGGDISCLFGGCELNLTQSDIQDIVTIDVLALFGGMTIIVPSNWEVKSEVTAIFGGLEDKRAIYPIAVQERKIIRIKGVALFGGVSIANY